MLSMLNQANGGLPLSVSFDAPLDGPVCFVLSGSVWSETHDELIGIALELDGNVIGSAVIFSNLNETHRAVVPSFIPCNLTFGTHKLKLVASTAATISDSNDFYDVVLIY